MRIRLRAAIIDVRTGTWDTIIPTVFDQSLLSSSHNREFKTDQMILELKSKAYTNLVEMLRTRYVR
jgi:hypothetical protein